MIIQIAARFSILLILAAIALPGGVIAEAKKKLKVCLNSETGVISASAKCKGGSAGRFSQQSYSTGNEQILYVAPSGAKYSDLATAIDAAFDKGPSATAPILIKVAPGTYNLTEQLGLFDHISVQGSGVGLTILNSTGSTGVSLGVNSTLRDLTLSSSDSSTSALLLIATENSENTVENVKLVYNGSASFPQALLVAKSSVHLSNFSVAMTIAAGATGFGIRVNDSADLVAENVTVSISDGTGRAFLLESGAAAKLRNCEFTTSATQGSDQSRGIQVEGASTTLFAQQVRVSSTESASGVAQGIEVFDATDVIFSNSHIAVTGFSNAAVFTSGSGQLKLFNSVVVTDNSNPTLATFDTGTLSSMGSQLSGGAVTASGGTVTCSASTDENFTFSASSCP